MSDFVRPDTRLRVASHDAVNPGNAAGFTVQLAPNNNELDKVDGFSVETVGFPNAFPNIVSGVNDTLFYAIDFAPTISVTALNNLLEYVPESTGIPAGVTLTIGTYSYSGLIVELDTKLPAGVSATITSDGRFGIVVDRTIIPGVLRQSSAQPMVSLLSDVWGEQFASLISDQGATQNTEVVGNVYQGSLSSSLVVPPGYYSLSQLQEIVQQQIQTDLDNAATGYTFSINPNVIGSGVSQFGYTGPANSISFYGPEQSLAYSMGYIGYTPASEYPGPGDPVSLTAAALPALQGVRVVYVHLRPIASSRAVDGDGASVSMAVAVPVEVPFGIYQAYSMRQDPSVSHRFAAPTTINELSVTLRDVFGRALSLPMNQEVYVVLRLHHSAV